MSVRRRKLVGASAAVATLALIGGVAAQFTTSTTSAPQQIGTGTVALALDNVSSTVWTNPIENLAAGDTVERFVDVRNSGSLKMSGLNVTQTNTLGALLSAPSDISVKLESCTVAWNYTTGTCAGQSAVALDSSSVRTWGTAAKTLNTFEDFGAGDVRHLKVSTSLSKDATNAVQQLAGSITYTFSGTQRAAGTVGNGQSLSNSSTTLGAGPTVGTSSASPDGTSVSTTFTDPSNGLATYSITWGPTGNAAAAQSTTLPKGSTSYTLSGLTPGTSYDITLTAQLNGQTSTAKSTYVASGDYSAAVLANDPSAYYRFSNLSAGQTLTGSVTDSSTHNNPATYAGTGVKAVDGTTLGTGASVAGNGHLVLPANGGWKMSGGITMEAVITPGAVSTWARLFSFGTGVNSNVNSVHLQRIGTTSQLALYSCNAAGDCTGINGDASALAGSEARHVMATLSPTGKATIYINGQVYATGQLSAPAAVTRSVNYLARSSYTSDAYWQGGIDEVALYDKVLTPEQNLSHYYAFNPAAASAPAAPVISSVETGEGIATWTPGAGAGITSGYAVSYTDSAGAVVESATLASNVTRYVPTKLAVGGNYTLKVVASNSFGSSQATQTFTRTRTYADVALADSPLAYYRLSEAAVGAAYSGTARDASGNGLNATYAGSGTTAVRGAVGSATSYNGSGYMQLPSGFRMTNGVTYEAWVNPTSNATWARIFDIGTAAGTNGVFFGRESNTTTLRITNPGGGTISVPNALPLNTLTHVATTVDASGNAVIYVNGVAKASGNVGSVARTSDRTYNFIGRSSFSADANWAGTIDEAAVYDKALSAAQIAAHYAAR